MQSNRVGQITADCSGIHMAGVCGMALWATLSLQFGWAWNGMKLHYFNAEIHDQ